MDEGCLEITPGVLWFSVSNRKDLANIASVTRGRVPLLCLLSRSWSLYSTPRAFE